MVGGIVQSFKVNDGIVTFTVKEKESNSVCHVKAQMDFWAIQLIDIGTDIWWHADKLFIRFDEVNDAEFKKIGNSY